MSLKLLGMSYVPRPSPHLCLLRRFLGDCVFQQQTEKFLLKVGWKQIYYLASLGVIQLFFLNIVILGCYVWVVMIVYICV